MMMVSTKAVIVSPIIGIGMVVMSVISLAVGPDLVIQAFPVLANQVVGNQRITPEMACYDWTYTKSWRPTLVRQSFYIERDDGIRYPVDELREDLGIPSNDSTAAEKGVRRTIPECVKVPKQLASERHFVVFGHKIYRILPGLPEIDQPVVPVEFYRPPAAPGETLNETPLAVDKASEP